MEVTAPAEVVVQFEPPSAASEVGVQVFPPADDSEVVRVEISRPAVASESGSESVLQGARSAPEAPAQAAPQMGNPMGSAAVASEVWVQVTAPTPLIIRTIPWVQEPDVMVRVAPPQAGAAAELVRVLVREPVTNGIATMLPSTGGPSRGIMALAFLAVGAAGVGLRRLGQARR